VRDADRRIVVAEAGIHLGEDPSDPLATLERSLLHQLWHRRGWTLSELGGITHQTVSGFTATASAGGSVRYSLEDSLMGFRVIDGQGRVREICRGDPAFDAMVPNLGLLGVISAVILRCDLAFDIEGTERISSIEDCAVDLFGTDAACGRLSLAQFLRDADFARLEWWPQPGAERIVVWQAGRVPHDPSHEREPYRRFGPLPTADQIMISLCYTVLGNPHDLPQLRLKLRRVYKAIRLRTNVVWALAAVAFTAVLIRLVGVGTPAFESRIPTIFPRLLRRFVPFDDDRRGREKGQPQGFYDQSWRGLPMDNALSDVFVPVEFTEAWFPLERAECVMRVMREYFRAGGDRQLAYRRTGLFGFELYAAKASRSWLSPAFTTGSDTWAGGAFRFNAYWFAGNEGLPEGGVLGGVWNHLYESGIDFRLHWGKFQPAYLPGDPQWVTFFAGQYDQWDAFLALRRRQDPQNVFLTSYWRDRFGLWGEHRPAAAAESRAAHHATRGACAARCRGR
jgi:D-arabinono-1,4-lactone oxidase